MIACANFSCMSRMDKNRKWIISIIIDLDLSRFGREENESLINQWIPERMEGE